MGDSRKIMQVRSARQVPVRVMLLDDELFEDSVDNSSRQQLLQTTTLLSMLRVKEDLSRALDKKRAIGWVLFDKVCDHLNLLEKDYFGLSYRDPAGLKFWLNNDKKISKQLKGQNWNLAFEIKFYSPEPSALAEDITRYQLCLQIRRDIVNEKLPCSFLTYTLLGSYTAQSEMGDYDTEEFGSGYKYLKDVKFAPHQDKDLLQKIAELHRQHKGQTPEESELHFLENAVRLSMYGVELHSAKDAEGTDISLGVCASGLIVYKDNQQMNRFVWPKVLKISYRRNKYYIKIRPGEFEEFASLIGFKLLNVKMAKRLWKISVEHHSFFRFREPDQPKSVGFMPRFGSRFRYSGRTQFQTRQIAAMENRDCPAFDRVMSKRGTFAGRTQNMRKRDQDRQQRRDEMRRMPISPDTKPPIADRPSQDHKPSPPEPGYPPPELKKAPPIAPKPTKPKASPRGPPSENASLDRSFDSFEDVPDRRSKMEKMHAVPTPLAAVMQKSFEQDRHHSPHHSEDEDDHRQQVGTVDEPIRGRRFRSHSETRYNQGPSRINTNTDRAKNRDRYLFSYPSSSIDSILSNDFDVYDGDKKLDDGKTRSVDNLNRSRANKRNVSDLSHRHSVENVLLSPEQSLQNSQPNKNQGRKKPISKTKESAGPKSDDDKISKIVHGRKSKYFSGNGTKPSSEDYTQDIKSNKAASQNPNEHAPKYAEINSNLSEDRQIKKKEDAFSLDTNKNTPEDYTQNKHVSRADRNSSSSLREELKMYILSPEKLSSNSESNKSSTFKDEEKDAEGSESHVRHNDKEPDSKTKGTLCSKVDEHMPSTQSALCPAAGFSTSRHNIDRKSMHTDQVSGQDHKNKSEKVYDDLLVRAVKVSDLKDPSLKTNDYLKGVDVDTDDEQLEADPLAPSNNAESDPTGVGKSSMKRSTGGIFVSGKDFKVIELDKYDNVNENSKQEACRTDIKETNFDDVKDSYVVRNDVTFEGTLSNAINVNDDSDKHIYENLPVRSKQDHMEDDCLNSSGSHESLVVGTVKPSHISSTVQGEISALSSTSLNSLIDTYPSEIEKLNEEKTIGQGNCGSSSSLYQIVFDGSSIGSPDDQKEISSSLTSFDINDLSQNKLMAIEDQDLERFSNVSSDSDEIDTETQIADLNKIDSYVDKQVEMKRTRNYDFPELLDEAQNQDQNRDKYIPSEERKTETHIPNTGKEDKCIHSENKPRDENAHSENKNEDEHVPREERFMRKYIPGVTVDKNRDKNVLSEKRNRDNIASEDRNRDKNVHSDDGNRDKNVHCENRTRDKNVHSEDKNRDKTVPSIDIFRYSSATSEVKNRDAHVRNEDKDTDKHDPSVDQKKDQVVIDPCKDKYRDKYAPVEDKNRDKHAYSGDKNKDMHSHTVNTYRDRHTPNENRNEEKIVSSEGENRNRHNSVEDRNLDKYASIMDKKKDDYVSSKDALCDNHVQSIDKNRNRHVSNEDIYGEEHAAFEDKCRDKYTLSDGTNKNRHVSGENNAIKLKSSDIASSRSTPNPNKKQTPDKDISSGSSNSLSEDVPTTEGSSLKSDTQQQPCSTNNSGSNKGTCESFSKEGKGDKDSRDRLFLIEKYDDEPFKRRMPSSKIDKPEAVRSDAPDKGEKTMDFFKSPEVVLDLLDSSTLTEKNKKQDENPTQIGEKGIESLTMAERKKQEQESSHLSIDKGNRSAGTLPAPDSDKNKLRSVIGDQLIADRQQEKMSHVAKNDMKDGSGKACEKRTDVLKTSTKDPFWYKTHLLPKSTDTVKPTIQDSGTRVFPDSKRDLFERKPNLTKEAERNKPGSQASKAAVAVAAAFHPRNKSHNNEEKDESKKEQGTVSRKEKKTETYKSVYSVRLSQGNSSAALSKMKDLDQSSITDSSKVPLIKGSKVYTKRDSKEDISLKQTTERKTNTETIERSKDSKQDHESILSGNLKGNLKQPDQCSSLSIFTNANCVSSLNTSLDSKKGSLEPAETSARKPSAVSKHKVTPGVIHIMNPCPAGWIEGGLEDTSKPTNIKSNDVGRKLGEKDKLLFADRINVENTEQISSMDIDKLEEAQTVESDLIANVDIAAYHSNDAIEEMERRKYSETGNSPRTSSPEIQANSHVSQSKEDSENILTTAPKVELLCKRVWVHSKRTKKDAEVTKTDDKDDDFTDEICRGPDESDYKYRSIGPSNNGNSGNDDGTKPLKTGNKPHEANDAIERILMGQEGEDFKMIDASDDEPENVIEMEAEEKTDCPDGTHTSNTLKIQLNTDGVASNFLSSQNDEKPNDTTEKLFETAEGDEIRKDEELQVTAAPAGHDQLDSGINVQEGNKKKTIDSDDFCTNKSQIMLNCGIDNASTTKAVQNDEREQKSDELSVHVLNLGQSTQSLCNLSGQSIQENDTILVDSKAHDTLSQGEEFNVENRSSDSDTSSGTHTDSDSSQEIELASFEMPQQNVQLVDSKDFENEIPFIDQGFSQRGNVWGSNYQHANRNQGFEDYQDEVTAFAIDCSFENVESYKVIKTNDDHVNETKPPILCECNFNETTINSPYLPINIHNYEHAPLYDNYYCTEDFYDPHHYRVPEVIDDTPFTPIRSVLKCKFKSESCLFDKRVHFQENLPVYKSSENLRSSDHRNKYASISPDDTEAKKLEYMKQFIHCLFESEPRNIGLPVRDNVLETLPSFDDDYKKVPVIQEGHSFVDNQDAQVSDKTRYPDTVDFKDDSVAVIDDFASDTLNKDASTFDARPRSPCQTDLQLPLQAISSNKPNASNTSVHSTNEKGPSSRHPRIVKAVIGGKQKTPTTNNVTSVTNETVADLHNQANTIACIDNTAQINDDNDTNVSTRSDIPLENQESLNSISNMLAIMTEECDKPKTQAKEHSSMCEAEYVPDTVLAVNGKDEKDPPNYQGHVRGTELISAPKKDLSASVKDKDEENGMVVLSSATRPTDTRSSLPSDGKITRYTYTYNDDSDPESPKIKSITYEYVTEYKLNNVKVHYKQNRKVQTDVSTQKDGSVDRYMTTIKTSRGKHTSMKDSSESSHIPVEEVMEKSVCYPLGPVFNIPVISSPESQDSQEENTIRKVSKTNCRIQNASNTSGKATAKDVLCEEGACGQTSPTSKDDNSQDGSWKATGHEQSLNSGGNLEKKFIPILGRGYLNKQVIEHNSEKYVWQSFEIDTSNSNWNKRTKVLPSSHEQDLKKKWTLLDDLDDSCEFEEYRSKTHVTSDNTTGHPGDSDAASASVEDTDKASGNMYTALMAERLPDLCVDENDSRPMTPEVIAQDEAPPPIQAPPPMSDKERKLFAKQEKERLKREKEEEKRRKKEEEKEKKRLEKERKSIIAEEKKAASKISKQKGKERKDPEREVRERRDSRSSNDIGREWNEAKYQDERGPHTPDRTRKRMSSFEDVKKEADLEDNDRPPTPPAPLPLDHDRKERKTSSQSGSDQGSHVSDAADDGEEAEEVSF